MKMGVHIIDITDIMHDMNVASQRTMPNTQTLSKTYDRSRADILAEMEARIRTGSRTKLTRSEREILIDILVDKLVEMAQRGDDTRDAIAQLCQAEVELLEKAYPVSSINSNYLPKYNRAIREAIEQGRLSLNEQNSYEQTWTKRNGRESGVEKRHHAFDCLVYDYETQMALRSQTTKANNIRQDNLAFVELDDYLETIEQLLHSNDALELIVGIAGATGRRHTEVVSVGEFQLRGHPYLLGFAGQQKKADDGGEYDILTLLPAVDILDAMGQLREHPEITDVVGKRADDPEIQRINAWVNRGVQKLLGDSGIVPTLEGFKTVSIHRLRGLYGAIAIHFFCPQHQREHRFLQHYLGHVIEGEISPNSRATDHYFHYVLTRNGKPLNARGVKVAAHGLVPIQEKEVETEQVQEQEVEAIAAVDAMDNKQGHGEMINQQLIETLQTLALHQGRTLEAQAQTIAELHQQLQMADRTSVEGAHRENELQHLREALQRAQAAAETYRAGWQATADEFNAVRAAMGLPPVKGPQEGAEETSDAETHQAKTEMRSPAENNSHTESDSKTSGPHQRAQAIWQLIQDWNTAHPDAPIMVNQSLLTGRGIHRDAAIDFLERNEPAITQEHHRIGVTPDNERLFNRGKLTDFRKLLDNKRL